MDVPDGPVEFVEFWEVLYGRRRKSFRINRSMIRTAGSASPIASRIPARHNAASEGVRAFAHAVSFS
jgi:hypothetical protein